MLDLRWCVVGIGVLVGGCGTADEGARGWAGSVDTLASGQIVVRNTAQPIWRAGEEWQVVEELRIGSIDADGPELFGNVASLEIDDLGRLWVVESQAQELRVFAADGRHVRTIGRRGGGPGEFASAVRVDRAPDGHMWVMDPQNNRISIFDTTGVYVSSRPALGGFVMMPWPGRFDAHGRYYAPVPQPGGGFGRVAMVRYDAEVQPTFEPAEATAVPDVLVDTMVVPEYGGDADFFELRTPAGGFVRAGVPYGGGLRWQISDQGTIWALVIEEYRLFELAANGDTLRTITREFTAPPVTAEDRESARENLKWFTDQGGRIDLSKLPRTKPPVREFFHDDEGNAWVGLTLEGQARNRFDVFDADGLYLGEVALPFDAYQPMIRDGMLYAVTRDELEVQYIVRARIAKS